MKTTFGRIGIILVLFTVGLAAYWMFLRPPEDPICKGIRLSTWLNSFDSNWDKSLIQPDDLRTISPRAVPFLIHYLRCNEPRTQKGIASWTPLWLHPKLPKLWVEPKNVGSFGNCEHALDALKMLGGDSESALPTLLIFLNSPHVYLAEESAKAIHAVGPVSWPAVHDAMSNGPTHSRIALVTRMPWRFLSPPAPAATKEDVKLAVDLLLEACLDPNAQFQEQAISSLATCRWSYHAETPLFDPAVPIIIHYMEVGTERVSRVAAEASMAFPEHAGTIIPALKKLAANPNTNYSDPAKFALKYLKQRGGRPD